MIDIDEIRNAHKEMHHLFKVDAAYTFYYDETNNIKKLRVDAQGLNVAEPTIFVLGGIVHDGGPRPLDVKHLRNALRIQKSADEIKFKHIAKGEFLDLLKSGKLTTFLQWLSDSDLFVHCHVLDPLYWSLVDIIDSILYKLDEPRLIEFHLLLKADLATLLRANLPSATSLFYRYNYPDIAPTNRKPFLDDLLEILEHGGDVLPEFNAMMLKGMLQAGRNLPSLDFIEGDTPHLLIESFTHFYLSRIALFKCSTHILDMEDSIRDEMEAMGLSSSGQPVKHYRFADSKSEPGIQVSDIIVGLLGKMYTYLAQNPRMDIAEARASLTGTSLKNAELLRNLIDSAHEANIAFLHHVASVGDIDKMNLFLRVSGSGYEE